MRRGLSAGLLPALAVGMFVSGLGLAAWASAPRKGSLVEESVHGRSLEGNLAGNAADRSVWVYLPPGYDTEPARRYPVVYLLSGIGDPNTVWVKAWDDRNPGYGTIPELMDSGVAAGLLQPMIVIIPDAQTKFPGSFYTNSPVMGRWEDFIAVDLVAEVDRRYRTIPRPEARGLAGHSMGGHGAIKIAMRHPEIFSVAYGMNPAVLGWGEDVSPANPAFAKVLALAGPEALPDDPYVFAIIGIGQAFSPDPKRPPFFTDFPFQRRNGHLVPASPGYEAWSREMPLSMVTAHAPNLKRLRGLRFDSAFVDEYPHIPPTSRALSDSLTARGVPHTFEMYNGDHRNRLWGRMGRLYTEVLPYFSQLLVSQHEER